MKQLFQTAQGTHIIEATSSELSNLLLARKAIDSLCDQFEFTIVPTAAPETVAPVSAPPVQQKATFVKSEPPSVKSDAILCSVCGKQFEVKRPGQKCCSKACLDKSYRLAKTKKSPIPAKKKPHDSDGLEPRVCRGCGKEFRPKRKDQTCCKVACRRKIPRSSGKPKKVTAKPERTPSDAHSQRACDDCGNAFVPWRRDQRYCSACAKKSHPAAKVAQKPIAPPAPPATPPPGPKAALRPQDRMAAIRAADARARLKAQGITMPANVFGSDSGIGAPTDADIAALSGRDQD